MDIYDPVTSKEHFIMKHNDFVCLLLFGYIPKLPK